PSTSSSSESEEEVVEQTIKTLSPTPPLPSLPPQIQQLPPPVMSQSQGQAQGPSRQQIAEALQKQINDQQDIIASLQQQINDLHDAMPTTAPQQIQAPRIEVAKPRIFSGAKEELAGFINACRLYITILMEAVDDNRQIHWILSFVQGGSAEAWKDNMMEQLEARTKERPGIQTAEELFDNLRANFGDIDEESTAVGKLRLIEQGGKTCDEHVQEFKRIARDSGYTGRALMEEYKRSLNTRLRKALMESESPPTTITSWYERSMKLDRQWRQAKAEEAYYHKGHETPKKFTPRPGTFFPKPIQVQPKRDPNAMEVDRTQGPSRRPITCFKCGKMGHMAKECWSKVDVRGVRIVETVVEEKDLKE